jgi:hypothetical protein
VLLRARVTDRDRPARDGESRFTLGIILPRSSSLAPPHLRPPRRTGNFFFFFALETSDLLESEQEAN